ncbi:uncharacterized protein LOC100904200 [Galendromus occidentalis]|uniref:Uncharacterized protein LOC100904200 n=1 Tax=Galendromus occidentalis TaxID=34638 RepID=A0AAJ6VZV9_9ACAR|nr:uncharacterized protein LOC100904200 [Galendromus occidentalis]
MDKSSMLRGPVLLVSRKVEASSSQATAKDGASAFVAPKTRAQLGEQGPQIQLVAITNASPAITLVQTAPSRSSKTYSEFPVDRNRAVFPGLFLGATFSSYNELTDLMQRFQRAKGVHLYIRSSRKLYPAVNNMGGTVREYNLDLMFADIYYSCTKGGRRFCRSSSCSATSSTNDGVRNCPFNIKLRLTRDGQRLYIRDIYPAHNHYLDRNSQPRIPHPSITESKLRPLEKPRVLLPAKAGDINAILNQDLSDDVKRLVLLTKTSRRILPIRLIAGKPEEDSERQTGAANRSYPDVTVKREIEDSDMLAESSIRPAGGQDDHETGIGLEPECILGTEEKIVPDVDDDVVDGEASFASTASQYATDTEPRIKEEILDEFPMEMEGDGGSSHVDIDFPCDDSAFLVSRQQILEMVKFCSRCGSRVANRYYSYRIDSLGVALICSAGHTVEVSLGRNSSSRSPHNVIVGS